MPQIKHIAIATQDADATAKFYTEVFGMREVAKLDSPNASGYFLSDGNINLAILDFKTDQVTGPEYGIGFSGIHHIGFEVESCKRPGPTPGMISTVLWAWGWAARPTEMWRSNTAVPMGRS